MAPKPGSKILVLDPITYWAYPGAGIPPLATPYGGDWGPEWFLVDDTAQGIQATFRNPKEAITSDERGRVGQVAGGDDGIALAFQDRTPELKLIELISSLTKVIIPAQAANTTAGTPAIPGGQSLYLDKRNDVGFMFGFEGFAEAGTLIERDCVFRGIAYNVENTENAVHTFRATGGDAVFSPEVALECLPGDLSETQLTGTNIPMSAIDRNRRFNYFLPDAA